MECIFFTNKKTEIVEKKLKRRNSFNLVFKFNNTFGCTKCFSVSEHNMQ